MTILDANYWSQRYELHQTGWDIGAASTPLIHYTNQYKNKNAAVLIPGCGNAHEAEVMLKQGYTNITLLDISPVLTGSLKNRFIGTSIQVLTMNFFDIEGTYDLILEQTFFCALDLSLRNDYTKKMYELLKQGGKFCGVLFNRNFEGGPPFGGNKEEYITLFQSQFEIKKMELCTNSIPQRQGAEVFFIAEKSITSHLTQV